MTKSTNLIFLHNMLCLSLLLLSSCANSQTATSEINTSSPTITPSTTSSPSVTPTLSITPTVSITPAGIINPDIHPLALNENNAHKIENLSTFSTPSVQCLISAYIDSSLGIKFSNEETEYLLASKNYKSRDVELWNLTRKIIIQVFKDEKIDSISFTPDYNTLATLHSNEPTTLTLWDIGNGGKRQIFPINQPISVERVIINQDGLKFAFFSGFWKVTEFDLQTNQFNDSDYRFPLYRETPAPHIYSPSGNLIVVTYDKDNMLHLLDLTNSTDTILQFPFSNLEEVGLAEAFIETITINSNEKYLAGGTLSGNIYVWDIKSGSLVKSFAAHKTDISDGWIGGVKILEFSPKSNLLLSVGYDHFTKLWDVNSGALLKEINTCHHFGGFTQDGRYLVTVGENGIEMWGIPE